MTDLPCRVYRADQLEINVNPMFQCQPFFHTRSIIYLFMDEIDDSVVKVFSDLSKEDLPEYPELDDLVGSI